MPSRRDFLKQTALAAACCACPSAHCGPAAAGAPLPRSEPADPVEARYYDKIDDLMVICRLCPRECEVADRERGYCGVRENRKGIYYTLVHSNVCAENIDPVEKKPMFHFLPGSKAYSIATAGCNIECKFCQNWEISQFRPEQIPSRHRPPARVVELADTTGCKVIAYTYSEPVVFWEYMYDCAVKGREKGVKSAMISNGYIEEKPLRDLVKVLDGVKIDLKAFTNEFYRDLCSGTLEPVLRTLKILKETGIWFEIVVLIIPTRNDSAAEIRSMCDWIAENLGDSVPIHFTRFHPTYKIKEIAATPVRTLERAFETARKAGLKFPYIGNVPGHEGENTRCRKCGKTLIERKGFWVIANRIKSGKCPFCSDSVPGIWKK